MTTGIASLALARVAANTRATTFTSRLLIRSAQIQRRGNNVAYYSSLRRPRPTGSAGGRITARTTAPSRAVQPHTHHNHVTPATGHTAAPIAAAGSTLESAAANASSSVDPVEETPSNIVEGLDIASTPAVVPEDPFGVLQRHDTAAKVLSQSALIMTRQIEMMNGNQPHPPQVFCHRSISRV